MKTFSDETRHKMSEAARKRCQSAEWLASHGYFERREIMQNEELINALRSDAEWAHANEWETPITRRMNDGQA